MFASIERWRVSHPRWAALFAFVGLTSCGGHKEAAPGAAPAHAEAEAFAEGPCVVSGPEICFNATDDNCNGLLDEGCGVRMGLVQFMAAWSDPDVDVDLVVTDPSGEVAQAGQVTRSGLTLQQDCPGKQGLCYGQNYENVYLDGKAATPGHYRVTVRLESHTGAEPPIVVRIGARIDDRSHALAVRLLRVGDEESVSFFLPAVSVSPPLGVASKGRDTSPR